jgi:hypothetical protein
LKNSLQLDDLAIDEPMVSMRHIHAHLGHQNIHGIDDFEGGRDSFGLHGSYHSFK